MESIYEETLAAPQVIQRILEAERNGMDAVVIDCMSDPGFDAVREAVSIPVIGQTQVCSFLASALSHRFSILGTRKDYAHKFTNQGA